MKYLLRCLSLLFALVMCVGTFSIIAHAESASNHTYTLSSVSSIITGDRVETSVISYPDNGTIERGTINDWLDSFNDNTLSDIELYSSFNIANDNNTSLFVGGRETTVRIENLYASFLFGSGSNQKYFYHNKTTILSVFVYYVDGTVEIISSPAFVSRGDGKYDVTFTFTPSKDVKKISYDMSTWLSPVDIQSYGIDMGTGYLTEVTINTGEYEDGNNYLTVEQVTQDTTLLKGLLDKVTNGFDNIIEKVTTGFENIIDSIVELPAKLWDAIENGLKKLFVPSEESMTAYKDKWDELLSSRFGAVYEVCDIVTESWSEIGEADTTDVINFPSVTIPLPDDAQFTFGGYEVKIVPDGFDVVVSALKLIVGIVCTLAFINGMLRRYDELMGVEQ